MNRNRMPSLKNESQCTGCGACIASCAKSAIMKKRVGFGAWIPEANPELCAQCGLCERVCSEQMALPSEKKRAYIAYNRDREMRLKSASGGVFSALAAYVLDQGGSVFGAEMRFENGRAVVEHSMITKIRELPRILGSKYVQSDCVTAYKQVKKELKDGKLVLFSGCSCQITGLKSYLRSTDQTNLYTIDLICHGTPGIDFFNDYIQFLEKKHKGQVANFSFRTKVNGNVRYQVSADMDGNIQGQPGSYLPDGCNHEARSGEMKTIRIPMRKSGYFRFFMAEESYREACYQCPYASLDKPADITIGDYFELEHDYPELLKGEEAIDCNGGVSCVITHSTKGEELLKKAREFMFLKEVAPKVVQASHGNLHRASKCSSLRWKLYCRYQKHGYKVIEQYYARRNALVAIPKRVVSLIKRIKTPE